MAVITFEQGRLLAPAPDWKLPQLADLVEEFTDVLASHPLKSPKQCISLPEAFWLWYLVRELNPSRVVESGTYEGFSLYFIFRAAPTADIHSFDPIVDPGYRIDGVQYHDTDWMEADIEKADMVFFDDHQDHDMRLKQAIDRDVRYVLLHDNYLTPKASHRPIRYTGLPRKIKYSRELPAIALPRKVTNLCKNSQAHRWLTLACTEPVVER